MLARALLIDCDTGLHDATWRTFLSDSRRPEAGASNVDSVFRLQVAEFPEQRAFADAEPARERGTITLMRRHRPGQIAALMLL